MESEESFSKGYPIFCRRCQALKAYAPSVNPFDDMDEWVAATDLATDECSCPEESELAPMPDTGICPTCKKQGVADHYDSDRDAMILKCSEGHEYSIESGPIEVAETAKPTQGHDWMGELLREYDCSKCGKQFQMEDHRVKTTKEGDYLCTDCAKSLRE